MRIHRVSEKKISYHIIWPFLMCFFLLLFLLAGCSRAQEEASCVEVIMIHNNPCESCDEAGRLSALLKENLPTEGDVQYESRILYAYQGEGAQLVDQAAAYFGLDKSEMFFPLVIVGDRCLLGEEQVEAGLALLLKEAGQNGVTKAMENPAIRPGADSASPARSEATAASSSQEQAAGDNGKAEQRVIDAGTDVIHLLYFHTEICAKCEKAQEALEALPEAVNIDGTEYPIVITTLSVAEGDNASLFGELAAEAGVSAREQQVPFLFLGEKYLSGADQITDQTLQLVEEGAGLGAVYRADGYFGDGGSENGEAADAEESSALPEYRKQPIAFLLRTVGVGFLNGFNPCALSLVLLFFSLIAAMQKDFLRNGLTFLAGKLTAYILLGLAVSAALSAIPFAAFAWVRKALNLFLIVLCLVLACGNFLDCYHAWKGEYGKIKVQLPGALRAWNDRMVKRIAGLGSSRWFPLLIFGGSMAIAFGEFFCTGQIYLASILQWVKQGEGGVPITAFILYSAALCLPSLIILLLIRKGRSVLSLANKSLKGMPWIKLCNGILFVIFLLWSLQNL